MQYFENGLKFFWLNLAHIFCTKALYLQDCGFKVKVTARSFVGSLRETLTYINALSFMTRLDAGVL